MSAVPPPNEFDIRPHPRILPMLGEINLAQWRCLAELIDNSVDGFLSAKRKGALVAEPEVHVFLPTVESPQAKVSVRDNGPGMDLATLESAVSAGWSGQETLDSLGMFGMGFNIATARLGTVTKVWTTRAGENTWNGLEIDFDKLVQQRNFKVPRLERPKADPADHGTEVTVEKLKPEQNRWFAQPVNRSRLGKELSRTYSAMLRPNGLPLSFKLMVGSKTLVGKQHCVWGGDGSPARQVNTSKGLVNALYEIDRSLGERPYCTRHSLWLAAGETTCSSCDQTGLPSQIIQRPRRVYGWVGLQRYKHAEDFGIDLLRNGRKLEIANKDLFCWHDGEGDETEYPIDDPRNHGRLVGEVHIDHCRVSYAKDRFDRNDPAWEEMVQIVRGQGPLRPEKASQLGFGPNSSPLFLLFQAFRRTSPKPKVAGCYAKLLIVPDNERAVEMAERFYEREPEYQTDAKWWELVEEADRQLLTTPANPPAGGQPGAVPGFGDAPPANPGGTPGAGAAPGAGPEAPVPFAPPRVPLLDLTRDYVEDTTRFQWKVRAFRVEAGNGELAGERPWAIKSLPDGITEFFVNTDHDIFKSATMTPRDGLLAQLASQASDLARSGNTGATFASILASLRDKYATVSKLDPVQLCADAAEVLDAIAGSISRRTTPEDSQTLFAELSETDRQEINRAMAVRGVRNPQQIITQGKFLQFAPRRLLLTFFESHPEMFFDGRCWTSPYGTLDYGSSSANDEARCRRVSEYVGLMHDVVWLCEQGAAELTNVSREKLLRAALSTDLLEPDSLQETEQ